MSSELIGHLQRNLKIVKRDSAGVSEENANKRMGEGGSMNWAIGHILGSRLMLLSFINQKLDGIDMEKISTLYGYNSKPNAAEAMPVAQLIELLEKAQAAIEEHLPTADLDRIIPTPFGKEAPAGSMVDFFAWHDALHTGQITVYKRWLEA